MPQSARGPTNIGAASDGRKGRAMIYEGNAKTVSGAAVCVLAGLLMVAGEAGAIGKFKATPAELRLLPAYCGPRAQPWGNDSSRPEVRRWFRVFGRDYVHMHHYCLAMLKLRRAPTIADGRKRRAAYAVARNNLLYMEKNVSRGFLLWPELKVLLAEAYRGLGDRARAVAAAQQALAVKPDYARAAVFLADEWVAMGRREEARRVLEAAIKHGARARSLMRRLACLEGRGRRCPAGYRVAGSGRER